MLLNLTDLSSEPLQGQIVRQIRAKILAGELPAGIDLPSIRKLAREQHISVITVQRAYESLEREGLIRSRQRKGFFVSGLSEKAKSKMARERLRDNLSPQISNALAEGLSEDDVINAINLILRKKINKR
ncbi:MAG: GntR family transcriptional regulator [Candidatus Aminicenantes bacterium]|nr:MAG: GntR family transcriptional regulator [Candidatus Aminicenantes bacterium]